LIGVAYAAVRWLRATERRHLEGRLPSENEGGNGFYCASRKLLSGRELSAACACLQTSLSRRAPPAMWSLVYEDESEGKEQPAHPRRVHCPTPVLHSINDAYRWRLMSSLLVCFSTSRNLETPLRCDRLNVARPFRSVGRGKDRSDHSTVESLTLPAAPRHADPPSRAAIGKCLIETP